MKYKKKKQKYELTSNFNKYYDLESLTDNKYYYNKKPLKIFLLIGLIILISIYSLNYYSIYFIYRTFNYMTKKINLNGYLIRKGVIYLCIMLIIEIIVISLYLILYPLTFL